MSDATKAAADAAATKAAIRASADKINKIEDEAPKADDKAAKKREYVVQNGSISPDGGKPEYHPGDVVELSSAMAKHYIKLGRLAPYVPEDE